MRKKASSRDLLGTILEILAILLICTGIAFIYWPAALITAGGFLLLIARGVAYEPAVQGEPEQLPDEHAATGDSAQ